MRGSGEFSIIYWIDPLNKNSPALLCNSGNAEQYFQNFQSAGSMEEVRELCILHFRVHKLLSRNTAPVRAPHQVGTDGAQTDRRKAERDTRAKCRL